MTPARVAPSNQIDGGRGAPRSPDLARTGARDALVARIGSVELAALFREGRLDDLKMRRLDAPGPRVGEIYAAQVDRLASGGAFLLLGRSGTGRETAFLPEADGLSPGDPLRVEITRDAEGRKAARAARRLAFAAPDLVLTPGAPGINLSRKIADAAERARLSEALKDLLPPEIGCLLRTSAAGAASDAIQAQARSALAAATEVATAAPRPPRLLRPAPSPAAQARTEWGDAVWREGDAATPLVDALRTALQALLTPRTSLAAGWAAFERTEALVAIDVNAGDVGNRVAVNLAAAAEIPRQLRLRGWGGQVIVDFAPMEPQQRARVEARMRATADGALRIAGWGPLGLLEATRRKTGAPIETMLDAAMLEGEIDVASIGAL